MSIDLSEFTVLSKCGICHLPHDTLVLPSGESGWCKMRGEGEK